MIIPNDDQIFAHSAAVNTTISGPASALEESHWYTMADFTDTVKPYKVFTALLTQSGGSGFGDLTSGNLTIGVTYFIQLLEGADFSNVGGSNIEGTYFIATGVTPNSWGIGGQLAYNAGAPVATVLENTIGNVWFTYVGVGSYQIPYDACAAVGLTNSNNAYFINNNTITQTITANIFDDGDGPLVQIYTLATNAEFSDNILVNTPIEIRVYN